MTQLDQVKFLECLDWKLGPLFEASITPVNELFENFLATFAETVNQFAPKRKATRKEKKLLLKPWISRGLLKSIQTKNKLFRQLQKNRDNSILHNKYKICRNTLNRALRMAKRSYYHLFLNEHKGNFAKVWEIVNELTYNKKRG